MRRESREMDHATVLDERAASHIVAFQAHILSLVYTREAALPSRLDRANAAPT
jgi:hypothetical protein